MTSFSREVLNIEDLRVSYPNSNKWVLNGFNLRVLSGEKVALIGSSGSGKSTVARVLLQIMPLGTICEGRLSLEGKDLIQLNKDNSKKIRGQSIGLVFQDPMTRLNPLMTVGGHLLDMLSSHRPDENSSWRMSRAKDLLNKVGISSDLFNHYPHEFSGGMRQRVAIALAIALNPPLIIADEPTSSLDVSVANQVMSELNLLCDELGSSLLLITHDLALAARWCNRMAILDSGRIVEKKPSSEFLNRQESFLGKRLIEAARNRELNRFNVKPQDKIVLQVDRLRCWHSVNTVPWKSSWIKAVDEVSFSLHAGETLGVVGLSGCGKSTLCRALLGLLPIRGGNVMLEGKNLGNLRKSSLCKARRTMQMVFQDPFASLNPKMNILEAISDPLLIHNSITPAQAKEKTRSLLEKVGLTPPEEFLRRFPHELSGGQQQRVAIARALALNPKVLVCDESVSMLDAEIQSEILTLLGSLQLNLGLAILFITHDLSVASAFCHRVLVLDKGKIIEEGSANQVFKLPKSSLAQKLVKACPRIT